MAVVEYPSLLEIGLTNLCTTSCAFCYRRDLRLQPRFFPFETFKSLFDELGPHLRELEFGGLGEPLMHPQFKDFASYARQKNPRLKLRLVTNGSLLSADLVKLLVEQRFGHVQISLNAATPRTHSTIMAGLDFERIIEAIKSLKEERDKQSLREPLILLTFVVTKDNYLEAEDFLDIGIAIGAGGLEVRALDALLNRDIYEKQHVSREKFEPILERIENRGKSDNRIFSSKKRHFWPEDFAPAALRSASRIYCPVAHMTFGLYFTSGQVTPCCYLAADIEDPRNCLGNIYVELPIQIWNGERAQSFRQSLAAWETAPDTCRRCLGNWGELAGGGKHSPLRMLLARVVNRNRVAKSLVRSIRAKRSFV